MNSRLWKLLLGVTTALTVTAAISVTALAAVTVTHPSSGQIKVETSESFEKMAIAEFDLSGRMTGLVIKSYGEEYISDFTLNQEYTTKIMRFTDFDKAIASAPHRTLGSKTLFVWEGDGGVVDMASGTYDPYGGVAMNTGTIVTIGDSMTFNSNGNDWTGTQNWMHIPIGVSESDWTTVQFDITLNSGAWSTSNGAYIQLLNGLTTDNGYLELGYLDYTWGRPRLVLNGNAVALGEGTTTTVTFVINQEDRVVQSYADGELVATTTASGTYDLAAVRFQLSADASSRPFDFTLDNIYVYEGAAPRTPETDILRKIVINEAVSMFDSAHPGRYDDDKWTAELDGKKAIHATTGVVYNGTRKVMLTNLPYLNEAGETMVPREELETVLGMTCGSKSGFETKNDVLYVPIEEFLSDVSYDLGVGASANDNLYILGTGSFTPSDAEGFNDALLYYRPDMSEIKKLYANSEVNGVHPRLIATQSDFDRLRAVCNDYLNNDFDGDGTADFGGSPHYTATKKYMANDAPMFYLRRGIDGAFSRTQATGYTNDTTSGSQGVPNNVPTNSAQSPRMNYQRYFASDIHGFAFAYHMTGDSAYAEAAWADMEIILNFPDLNLSHKLDVSEAMAGLAIGYDWLYDYWVETGRAQTIEEKLYELCLYVSWSGYSSSSAPMASEFIFDNNHGAVANNGALMAALALIDIPEYTDACAWIASQAIKGMEINIDKWSTEMWYEGASYWELTMMHTVKFLDVLDGVLGTDFGISNLEGLSNAAKAELLAHSPRGIYNFGDANTAYYFVPELYWLDNRYGDGSMSHYIGLDISYKYGVNSYQWILEDYVLGALWYDVDKAWDATVDMEFDYVNEDLGVVTARNSWDWQNYVFFGAKGGNKPGDGHAHLDAGSFVFEANGVRWAQELGMGTYDNDYFNEAYRPLHMSVRAENHNTIIDNHTTSGADQIQTYADLSLVKQTDEGIITTVDMTDVLSKVSTATRGFFFTDNRQSLVIRDELTTNASSTIYWTMVLPSGVTITDNGDSSFTLSYTTGDYEEGLPDSSGYRDSHTETLRVEYVVTGGTVGTITTQTSNITPIDSENILDTGKYSNGKLQIPVTASSGANVQITVKLTPGDSSGTLISGATDVSAYTGGISTWADMLN